MGSAIEATLGDNNISFPKNIITDHGQFDEYQLLSCTYLNLRSSSFITINTHYLQNLLFIDIAFSQIQYIDLRDCTALIKSAHDATQNVIVNKNVEV